MIEKVYQLNSVLFSICDISFSEIIINLVEGCFHTVSQDVRKMLVQVQEQRIVILAS